MTERHGELCGQKPNGVTLALGQRGLGSVVFFQESFQDHFGEAKRKKSLASLHGFNRWCKIVGRVCLEHKAKCTSVKYVMHYSLGGGHGQNDDLAGGIVLHDLTGCLQPVQVWHIDV